MSRRRRLILLLTALALPLAAEVTASVILKNRPLTPRVFRQTKGRPGYGLMPNAISDVRMFGRDLRMSVDANGFRATPNGGDRAAQRVHVIGDSQVFGWGLSDDETVSAHLQTLLGGSFNVINRGVPGFGPINYEALARSVPESDWIVVVNTEENDFWDAYGLFHDISAHCGYLNAPTILGRDLPCTLLDSSIAQTLGALYSAYNYRVLPTPLEYNPKAEVATHILSHRIKTLYQPLRAARPDNFLTATIPWVCRYVPEQKRFYYPPVTDLRRTISFDDDCKVDELFDREPNPAGLYIDGDTHLSAKGAKLLAQAIAKEINYRQARTAQGTTQPTR